MATADLKAADDEIDEHTKPPFLRRVRIRGYKSIAFCDVTLEALTVLVGRNASGKSNFLDALAFLRDAVDINISEAVKRHGGWSSVVCRSAKFSNIEFEFEVKIARDGSDNGTDLHAPILDARYFLHISGGEQVRPMVHHERLELRDKTGAWKVEFERGVAGPGTAPTENPTPFPGLARLPNSSVVGEFGFCALKFMAPPSPKIANELQGMSLHNVQPDAIRRLRKPSNGSALEKHAGNLASVIRSLDPVSLHRVKQYVCHVVGEVSDFWVQPYGEYETVRFRMRTTAAGKPLEFDAESMSDGTLRVLSNIVAAFQNDAPVVGIEEPETALHPRAMNALVDALDEATLRTQVLLTTHSAELLDNPTIQPKNVRVVEMVDGQTIIAPVDAASVEIVQRNLNTLGGLERDNQLEADLDDRERQQLLWRNGQEPHP